MGFLRSLLNIWCDYATEHENVSNCKKNVGVVFPSKGVKALQHHVCFSEWRAVHVEYADQGKYHGILLHVSLKDDYNTERRALCSCSQPAIICLLIMQQIHAVWY